MYTQCPECGVAFRVTADILKQAAGKVRCGGCAHAFNALEHLSEEKPAAPTAAEPEQEAQSQPPELTPESPAELEADTPPKTISAAESAALLKTLDQLAGSDIRIEDTGVEWRVLDEDEEPPGDDDIVEEIPGDEAAVEQLLQQSFKPIDEVITESAGEAAEPARLEEMRFDDNTPLPEDFDFESPTPARAEEPIAEAPAAPEPEPAEAQVDLAFGDPDEWQDLLGDIEEPAPVAAEVEQEPAADAGEAAADEQAAADEPLAEQPPDMDTQFALQAEAMGIDLSGMHAKAESEAEPAAEPQAEDDKLDTTIEEDLIAAAFEKEAAELEMRDAEPEPAVEPEELEHAPEAEEQPEHVAAEQETPEPVADEEPAEVIAAEEVPEPDLEREPTETDAIGEAPAEDEVELAAEFEDLAALDAELEELIEESAAAGSAAAPAQAAEEAEESVEDLEELEDIELELDEDVDEIERRGDVDEISAVFDDDVEAMIETVSAPGERDADSAAGVEEHVIPEMSEEEKTINMMIDQELFNIAVEDEDGFASTIVQLQPSEDVDKEIDDNKKKKADKKAKKDKKPKKGKKVKKDKQGKKEKAAKKPRVPLVETIIMEGESVRAELDGEDDSARFNKPAVTLPLPQEPDDYARRGEIVRSNWGMIAGIGVLLLLLVLQAVHQSRESLATLSFFSKAAGPVYRMLGKPLTPIWNISGWRFEATKGSTDENDEQLTIYSRVGNDSDTELPYPLVHVSLTDRFEEIIGSRVLEPSEYLAENTDPRKLVPPGNTFNAVISIASPAAEATGFKLNVCYRLASGQLRCAIEDFK